MTETTITTPTDQGDARAKPTLRVWLVQDGREGQRDSWTDLTGLWPTKSGDGYSGFVDKPVAIRDGKLVGRIVILPAKDKPRG